MVSEKRIIQDIYSIQLFQKVFSIYLKVLTPVAIITLILGVTTLRSLKFEHRFFDEFFGTLLIIVVSSSIVFSAYMLFVLFKEKRKNWVLLFLMMVLLPYLLSSLIFQQFMFFKHHAAFPIIILYYIYCLALKYSIRKWISEYYWHQNRLEQKRLKEKEEEKLKSGLF